MNKLWQETEQMFSQKGSIPRFLVGVSLLLGLVVSSTMVVAARSNEVATAAAEAATGPWLVHIVDGQGQPHALALWTLMSDGTMLQTVAHLEQLPDESSGSGAWQVSGDNVAFTVIELRLDADGMAVGTVKLNGTVTLNAAQDGFSGRVRVDRLDLDGNTIETGMPSVRGERIVVEGL